MPVWLAYAACCMCWGSTWLAIKLGLRDLPPLTFAAARMSLATAVLLPFAILLTTPSTWLRRTVSAAPSARC